MGKAGRNEMKRVAANFLNSAAVALLTAGYIGPLLMGRLGGGAGNHRKRRNPLAGIEACW